MELLWSAFPIYIHCILLRAAVLVNNTLDPLYYKYFLRKWLSHQLKIRVGHLSCPTIR